MADTKRPALKLDSIVLNRVYELVNGLDELLGSFAVHVSKDTSASFTVSDENGKEYQVAIGYDKDLQHVMVFDG